jgi:hypothetical protein
MPYRVQKMRTPTGAARKEVEVLTPPRSFDTPLGSDEIENIVRHLACSRTFPG